MCVGDLISFESGTMSIKEKIRFFSELIQSGVVWKLDDSYGSIANKLIHSNIISKDGKINCYPEKEFAI